MSANSSSVFVPAAPGPTLHTVLDPPDTICNGADFYVSTCGGSMFFNVTNYYGDGTSDNTPLSTTGIRHASIFHHYAFPGNYTVKQVLFDGILSVDSATFTYKYSYCSTLPVKFYFDNNADCLFDSGDTYLFSPVKTEVDSNGIAVDTISSISGFYYLSYGAPGTVYSFKVISMPSYYSLSCPYSGILYDTIQTLVNRYPVQYFGLNCLSSGFDLSENAVIFWTAGGHQNGNIYVQNSNKCDTGSATVTLHYSPKYKFTGSASPRASSFSGSSITWTITGLHTASKPVDLYYGISDNPATGFVPLGDTVISYFTITPFIGDIDTTNNSQIIVDTSAGGCDPNFMLVDPPGCLPSGIAPNALKYTISFENTGNDTAFNIHIMDTLPSYVNAHSLQVVAASDQMDIALFNAGGYNIVKFDFPNINLLDSSHHGQSDGMVVFTVNTLPGLSDAAKISNRAGIYFDYNPVVMTNTVENVIGCPILKVDNLTKKQTVEIFPNPATDELTIKMDNGAYASFIIANDIGQVMVQQQLSTAQTRVNIKSLSPGLYYITLKGDNGTTVRKLVKM
jgi:uncharacterized repeat protein (TIGR01451 family)